MEPDDGSVRVDEGMLLNMIEDNVEELEQLAMENDDVDVSGGDIAGAMIGLMSAHAERDVDGAVVIHASEDFGDVTVGDMYLNKRLDVEGKHSVTKAIFYRMEKMVIKGVMKSLAFAKNKQ